MRLVILIALWAVFVGAVILLSGLIWMLALGIAAQVFHNHDLALNYWQSVIVALFANMILGGITARLRKKD